MRPTKDTGIVRVLAVLLFGYLASVASAQDLTLPQQGTDPVVLHVPDDTPDERMLTVYLSEAKTPIAGRYMITDDTLSFAPAFGFEPGRDYEAHVDAGGDVAHVAFHVPDQRVVPPAAVIAVYPSGDTLPENTLRFYIHFSTPMQPNIAFDYIKLRDDTGTVDEAAFMRFKQELWNEDRTRLTVLIDPGRIKREVATNAELGPALRADHRYALVVEAGWPSADGTTVLPAFTKTFQVSEALRSLPDARSWSKNVLCVDTRAPLTITFDRPFDRHLLTQSLRVQTAQGRVIEGEVDVVAAEQIWRFPPTRHWPYEELQLIADTTLEDVAGNNFQDLLDHIAVNDDNEMVSSELLINTRHCTG